jgi:DNA polymerase (family X)
MDLAADALAELDIVVGSVHSHMNLEPAEMTDRLLRAMECPQLRIIGHPTGRILMHRDPYPFDFERVAAEAAAAISGWRSTPARSASTCTVRCCASPNQKA